MRAEDLEGEVSQRRQLEQELRELRRAHARLESRLRDSSADLDMANEQAAQLAAIVESSDDAIVGTTLGGIVTIWNRGAEQLFGYSAEEIIGQPTATHMRLNWPDELKAMKRVRNGEHVPPFEAIRTRKDSKEIHVSVRISPIRDGQGRVTGASAIFRDITERKNLEERARQSQKMEAIGQLAGGVAHDFNNLLTVISGYTEMLLTSADADDPARELLEEVRKAGEQAATLTRQLLAFSRKQVLEERVLDLNAIIGDTQTMLRRLIGEDVGLTTALASELDRIRADAGQIQQVILNLAVNARDAMPQGGELVIGTANVELSEAEAQELGELAPGRYVLLAVTDTGCGMPPEVQARLFEPFFTTKGHGKGTGLGLATVYGIVRQSGSQRAGPGHHVSDLPASCQGEGPGGESPRRRRPAGRHRDDPPGGGRTGGARLHAVRPGSARVHDPGGRRRRGRAPPVPAARGGHPTAGDRRRDARPGRPSDGRAAHCLEARPAGFVPVGISR